MQQEVGHPVDDMTHAWGIRACGRPARNGARDIRRCSNTSGARPTRRLQRYAKATDGSLYDGILMNYVNPVTWRACHADQSAPRCNCCGPARRRGRIATTGSHLYQVAKGSGHSDHPRQAL